MKILLHVCCANCAIYPLKRLRGQSHKVHGLFYNPNIHPFTEFELRLEAAKQFAEKFDFDMQIVNDYGLTEFLRRVVYREETRCVQCYDMRLEWAASVAKERGFDAFTTTLLVSPYQKHDLLRQIAENVARKFEVPFYYEDMRSGYRWGQEQGRTLGFYRQKYCGCIYSEHERYSAKIKS